VTHVEKGGKEEKEAKKEKEKKNKERQENEKKKEVKNAMERACIMVIGHDTNASISIRMLISLRSQNLFS